MPIVKGSTYDSPLLLKNRHLQTIAPALVKRYLKSPYERERIELEDGDFLDIDWCFGGHRRLMVITHGLEGSTRSPYVRSISNFFIGQDYDVLAWNCRSCSEEINRTKRLYHHGEIEDIQTVLKHAQHKMNYEEIYVVGFSMGGNIILKLLGVSDIHEALPIKAGVAVSVPCDLEAASKTLDDPSNYVYLKYFKTQIKQKLEAKNKQFPGWLDLSIFETAKTWREIDEVISAPLTGMPNAQAFYEMASSRNFIEGIDVPVLILNARNDPVLTDSCNPWDIAEGHPNIYLEVTESGGHVGFPINYRLQSYAERRAASFFAGR